MGSWRLRLTQWRRRRPRVSRTHLRLLERRRRDLGAGWGGAERGAGARSARGGGGSSPLAYGAPRALPHRGGREGARSGGGGGGGAARQAGCGAAARASGGDGRAREAPDRRRGAAAGGEATRADGGRGDER